MKELGYIVLFFGILGGVGLMFLGTFAPETYIYLEREVPKRYKKEVVKLGLLDEGESLRMFYTDALLDIKEGMYFITDEKLVVYCKAWEEPETIIPFTHISHLEVKYNNSWLDDSYVSLETFSGDWIGFPLSSEKGRDKIFYQHLELHAALDGEGEELVEPPVTFTEEGKFEVVE